MPTVKITNWGFEDYKPNDMAEVESNVANMLIGSGHAVLPEAEAPAPPEESDPPAPDGKPKKASSTNT